VAPLRSRRRERARARAAVLLCLLAHGAAGADAARAESASRIERRIAITIDDLPWATLGDETPPTLAEYHAKLMAR
jgi:hypothetical protein